MKIAPTLRLAVESPFFMPGTKNKLRAELHAILAVARAAKKWNADHEPMGCLDCEALAKATARLYKVSR